MEVRHLDANGFRKWRHRLGSTTLAHVERRIVLLMQHGTKYGPPNVKLIGPHLRELRIPDGTRLYFTVIDETAWFVEYGNKDSQQRDIERAMVRVRKVRHEFT